MTLILSPADEERLRAIAHLRGQDPQEALGLLLDQALSAAEAEIAQISADLRASIEDFATGRSMTLEEWWTGIEARRQDRVQRK